jgi:ribonuclease D
MNRGLTTFSQRELEAMRQRAEHIPRLITAEEISGLPGAQFNDTVEVIDDANQIRPAIEEISQWDFVGFDTETKPNFRKGQRHKPALIQIAGPAKVFLFRLCRIGFPHELARLMENPGLLKIGIAIDNDLPELALYRSFKPAGMVDLNQLCPLLGFESIGARKLAALFLGVRLSKGQQTSNWENPELSPAQKAYAANDARVCREIYALLLGISV